MKFMFGAVRRVLKPAQGAQFWLGQISLVISTVLGVYLAAHAGFEKALQFEGLLVKRNVYYLLTSLEAEVTDNVKTMQAVAKEVPAQMDIRAYLHGKQLDSFIWETMKQTELTFRAPATVLTGIRRYYGAVDELRVQLEAQRISRSVFAQRLKEENYKIKKDILPQLKLERDTMLNELTAAGIQVAEATRHEGNKGGL
jgi:hypothetical protein